VPPVESATARLLVRDFVAAELADVPAPRADPEVAAASVARRVSAGDVDGAEATAGRIGHGA
jgi:hypothetical protein